MNDVPSGERSDPETKTDWQRLRAMTDAEVRAAVERDPDVEPTDAGFWVAAKLRRRGPPTS